MSKLMMLRLTSANGTSEIRLSIDSIETYTRNGNFTSLRTKTGYEIRVQEKPEDIDKALQEGYVYIKRVEK